MASEQPGVVFRGGSAFSVRLTGWQAKRTGKPVPEGELFQRIARFFAPPEGFFPLYEGARFWSFCGDSGVVVVELSPAVHAFRWIRDLNSLRRVSGGNQDLGEGAQYETRSMALPYVVLVMPFYKGVLQTGTSNGCQVFYRREPLASWGDNLLMTNLLNVANGYGYTSWLCMVGYQQEQGLSWQQAIEKGVRYFFWSAFNRSSEVHEQNSHYSTAREKMQDRRISTAALWEEASQKNPKFMVEIPWPETGHTVLSAMKLAASKLPVQKINLVNWTQDLVEKEK